MKQKTTTPLTGQQIAIIGSTGNININAVAGSGKTTTIIEYAAARPHAKILYLAFNKTVRQEAIKKFQEKGLSNVHVETAHSLAYRYIVRSGNYHVKTQSYRTHEITEMLSLYSHGQGHTGHIIANHINKFITFFCNSSASKVQELDYAKTLSEKTSRDFARSFYEIIEKGTRQLLARMDRGEIPIIHDFYLKKFQLSNPVLNYDYILFDEGQDASSVMLDIFQNQKAVKVIVGDLHQQIYGWRYAVNSFEQTKFPSLNLSESFRFPQPIANLASEILAWKHHLGNFKPVAITGSGTSDKLKTRATIARSNLGLLLKAIEYITDNRKVKKIFFEGNLNSYTYGDDGASLYDVLNLQNNKRDRIRDKLIASMNSMEDLEEYIEKTEDMQLSMMVEIVKEYGDEIFGLLKTLKEKHVENEDREKAEMIFSTVHRAKGMEYDEVILANDFISEQRLEKLLEKEGDNGEEVNKAKLNEEINLLYVAVTRTKNILHIPDSLIPKGIQVTKHIKSVKSGNTIINEADKSKYTYKSTTKTYNRFEEKLSKDYKTNSSRASSYQPWSEEDDEQLELMFGLGDSYAEIAEHFGRTKGAIISRLKKLGLY